MAKLKPNQFQLSSGAVITEHPILFSTEMVKANLEGRKTQTRRTKGLDKYPNSDWLNIKSVNGTKIRAALSDLPNKYILLRSPYGQLGDLLYVREAMIRNNNSETYWPVADGYVKTAVYEKKIPSIHLPKTSSRIWSMIEDIRVERLVEISEEDAKAEGVFAWVENRIKSQPIRYKVYSCSDNEPVYARTAKLSFESLWGSINGEDSWRSNPWVWVIQYRILSKTGRPSLDVIEKNYLEITGKEVSHDH